MLRIYLIRHGKTEGNLSGKYIGSRTDEPLCQEGIRELEGKTYPKAALLFVSPMQRCRQTGELLYPGLVQKECPLLKECDFGDFENKNYKELSGNPDYQAWIDSGGTLPFPGRIQKHFASGAGRALFNVWRKPLPWEVRQRPLWLTEVRS